MPDETLKFVPVRKSAITPPMRASATFTMIMSAHFIESKTK